MTGTMRKVWKRVAKRIGMRKSGLVKLHHDVRTCEYKDVHIMWEMLKKNDTDQLSTLSAARGKSGHMSNFIDWAKCAPFLCRGI